MALSVISAYLLLNALLVAGFAASACLERLGGARERLARNYWLLGSVLFLVALHPLLPSRSIFEPPAKLWTASSSRAIDRKTDQSAPHAYIQLAGGRGVAADRAKPALAGLALTFAGMVALGCVLALRDLRILRGLSKRAYLVRRIAHVLVLASDEISIPISFWWPGRASVLVPTWILADRLRLKLVLAHEIQHHRQGDTRWIHALAFLRRSCAWNPIASRWLERIEDTQEFACDETLVGQRKVESRRYADCLVEVAENALARIREPVRATGLASIERPNLLRRRIEAMFKTNSKPKLGRRLAASLSALAIVAVAMTALAAKGLVHDRRVSVAEAEAWVARASIGSEIPIVVNSEVLQQLNRFLGTPDGREYMRAALDRMEAMRPMLEAKARAYGVPLELLAIGIVESGYRNLPAGVNPVRAAGIWQFIAGTADRYGLVVNDYVDERMNPEAETDAAMRYLKSNHLFLRDWLLSTLAYNTGEERVLAKIRETGSRDPWTLLQKGLKTDRDYLPKVMAAIIILKNPDSIR